jgi:NAD-dependent histone deacetylase SIR2
MHERGKLLRCYTQNIDGIETTEGLAIGGKEGQVCQLHGDIHTLRCDYCSGIQEYTTEWMEMLLDGEAPDCPDCIAKCIPFPTLLMTASKREAMGKRSLKIGTLLPNIVLYNDPTPHPSTTTTATVISADKLRKPDLMLIFGTSLKVHGIKKLVKDFAKTVHANKGLVIFINKGQLPKSEWSSVVDYWVEGDCDAWVHDLKSRIPHLWMKQQVLPIMTVIKSPKKITKGTSVDDVVDVDKVSIVIVKENKENYPPSTPKKTPLRTYQTTLGLPSPLSPSKRGINQNAPESPSKRFQTGRLSVDIPPPKMNLPIAGGNRR